MKETKKSVLDIESGVKNLSEEQVKELFHPFVESVARRQKQSGNPFTMEKLIMLGEEGLLEAWHQYSPSSGCKFVPYAVWFVRKAMEENVPNNGTISCICQKFIVTLQRFCCNK